MPHEGDAPCRCCLRGDECSRAALRRAERSLRGCGERRRGAGPAQALRPRDRRRAPAHRGGGARARTTEGRGRRRRPPQADRVEPQARDVDHAQLHPRGRRAARPDPGGQPRPHARRRQVRLDDGLQALDVRDLVDPAGRPAGAGGAEPDDPPARPHRRPGAPRAARAADARPGAEPRPDVRRDRGGDRADARSGSTSSSSWCRTTSASRRPSATARAS